MAGKTARGVYLTIAQTLRGEIEAGTIPQGEAIASEALLGERFGVARETVRRALAELERDQLIVTIPGKGRFVAGNQAPPANLAETLRAALASKRYVSGDLFATESELVKQYGVGRYVARKALAELEQDGLVVVRAGKGRYVV